MKAVILAGGFGKKLYPITENEPKAMLGIGNRTVLDYLVYNFESTKKIDEYVIVSNHKFYSLFLQWANTRDEKVTVIDDGAEDDTQVYGGVKDIQLAIDKLAIDEDTIICASDLLFDFSFISFIDYSMRKGTTCCLRYYEENELKLNRSLVADIGFNDDVKSIECKPKDPRSQWCIPHLYYFVKDDVAKIKEALGAGINPDSLGEMIEYISKQSKMYAVEMPGAFARLTNEASLRKARKGFNPYG